MVKVGRSQDDIQPTPSFTPHTTKSRRSILRSPKSSSSSRMSLRGIKACYIIALYKTSGSRLFETILFSYVGFYAEYPSALAGHPKNCVVTEFNID